MRKLLAVPLLALVLTGCAADDGTARLNVRPAASDDRYVAKFDRALFTESDGQTDVVLLGGTGQTALPDGTMANGPAVRQVVHLKVLWTPNRTIRIDSPSAGNAMIDWQVSAGDADRVTYAGSCWAKVSVDGNEAAVDVRNASVSVRQVTGRMADPLKQATLDGQFVATRSDATVKAYVADLGRSPHAGATAALPAPAPAGVP